MPASEVAAPPAPSTNTPTALPPPDAGERSPSEFMGDISEDFAEMDAGRPAPKRDEKGKFVKPAEKSATPKTETKPAETETKPPESETKPAEDATKSAETETPKPVKAADLRTAYDGLKKKVREELEPELSKLKAKVQQYEAGQGEQVKGALESLKSLKARNDELERHIAFLDYSKSKDFKEKYAEPYRQAWNDALAEFRELTVREPAGEDDMGNPKFNTRPADENDLLRLANMKLSDMDAAASEMFGPSSARAISHIQNIRKLSAAQHKALQEAETNAGKVLSEQQLQNQTRAHTLASTWTDVNKGLEEKFPKAFKVEEGNAEDQASHLRGFALADLLFMGNAALRPEQVEALPASFRDTIKAGKPLSEVQKVQLHALARLKMANHDRKVAALKVAQARIKELETTLAEYEKSEPAAGRAGRGAPSTGDKDWLETAEDELKAMDK